MSKLFFSLFTLVIFCFSAATAFSFQTTISPRLRVSEKYDDNIFLTRVDKEADYITAVSLGFTSELLTKKSEFSLSYDPQYNTYAKRPELNSWNHLATLNAKSRIAKHIEFGLSDIFRYTDDPNFYVETFEDEFKGIITRDFTIRKTRQIYYSNTARADLSFQLSDSDTFGLQYLYSFLENQDPELEDNRRHEASMAYNHRFSPLYNLEMDVSYTRGEFETAEDFEEWGGTFRLTKSFTKHLDGFLAYEHTLIGFDGDGVDYQVYNPSIGFSYEIMKQTSLSLSGGYFYQDRDGGGGESGPTGDAEIEQTFEKGSISFFGSGGADESYFGSENLGFGTYYEVGGRFSWALTQTLSVNAEAAYRKNEYPEFEEIRRDDINRASIGFSYAPWRIKWLFIDLSYTYNNVDSNDNENDYANNQVLLVITLTPEQPFKRTF